MACHYVHSTGWLWTHDPPVPAPRMPELQSYTTMPGIYQDLCIVIMITQISCLIIEIKCFVLYLYELSKKSLSSQPPFQWNEAKESSSYQRRLHTELCFLYSLSSHFLLRTHITATLRYFWPSNGSHMLNMGTEWLKEQGLMWQCGAFISGLLFTSVIWKTTVVSHLEYGGLYY